MSAIDVSNQLQDSEHQSALTTIGQYEQTTNNTNTSLTEILNIYDNNIDGFTVNHQFCTITHVCVRATRRRQKET